jgi:hypothetical protein
LENIVRRCKKYNWVENKWNRHPKILDAIQKKYPWTAYLIGRSFWEAHHKHAVKDGGGGCGLDNYETLCYGCHTKTFGKKKEVIQEALSL